MPDFSKFDGSGRIPRPGQHIYLNRHLAPNWDKAQVHAGVLSTGLGKSGVSRAIQLATGADILTISNALVTQYAGDYPSVNVLKGKAHYTCSSGMSCKDWAECGFEPCERCPYQAAKGAAHAGFATFFNPMSYYYHLLQGGKGSDTLIVDECFPGDQQVHTEDGPQSMRTLYRAYRRGEVPKVLAYNQATRSYEYRAVTMVWKRPGGDKPTVKFKISNSTNTCTYDHKLLTFEGWVSAGDLKPGDVVVGTSPSRLVSDTTEEQKQVIYGSYLGDGSIDRRGNDSVLRLRFVQGEDQRDYLNWKASAFPEGVAGEGSSGYGGKRIFNYQTKYLYCRDMGLETVCENISPLGLAIWAMDDGSFYFKRTGEIQSMVLHTNAFSEDETRRLAKMLLDRFSVQALVCKTKKYWYLRFNLAAAERLYEIISPYLHVSMKKKHRAEATVTFNTVEMSKVLKGHAVKSVEPVASHRLLYDLEVEEHHNFVCAFHKGRDSGGFVAHNCHQLPGMISLLSGKKFKRSEYAFSEKVCNELYFVKWAEDQIRRLTNLSDMYYKRNELEKLSKAKGEIENLALLKQGIEEDPQNYVFWVEKDKRETYLHVKPVFAPRFLMDRLLGNRKVILLSGTLFDHDIKEITGDRTVLKYEMPSPIPVENRLVHWKPAPFKINYQTDPKALAEYIQSHLVKGENTLIHAPYSWSEKLAPFFPKDTITNTADDKEEKIEEFKRRGGVFLASGCAEGVDFKGKMCTLNVIPKLNFPDLADPIVQKRKAMQDGESWYQITTLLTLIQQAGRSTRAADDFSTTLVLDPNFKRIFNACRRKLPQYFIEAVRL